MIEILLALLVVIALVSLLLRNLLAAIIMLGVFSLVSCLLLFVLHAPDVALTEAAVGTGVGTLVLVWVVVKTERRDST